MPIFKPDEALAPEIQIPKVIKLQEEALGQIMELKKGDVATLIKILDGERNKHAKLEEELLVEIGELRDSKEKLEETIRAITVPNEETVVSKKDIRIPAGIMLLLLLLAALAGGTSTALFLN